MATVTADCLRRRPRAEVEAWLASLTPDEREALAYDWGFWARPSQRLPDGQWLTWLLMGGRGMGKTRTGAETVRRWVNEGAQHLALVGKTPAEVRDVMIVNPLKSGLLDVFPPHQRAVYEPSKKRVVFHTGAIGSIYSGEEPNSLRGPAHDKAWVDELPKFQYPTEVWDNLMFGLRVGALPQVICTTTPLPLPIVKRILHDPQTVLTRGSTHDNLINLAPTFREQVLRMYRGTRLERQEIYGELLTDVPGALWNYEMFQRVEQPPTLECVAVAIDPAVTATEDSDETGIVVAGTAEDGHAYVLADVSGRYTPSAWAHRALDEYERWDADRIVCEVNNGGDMVVHTIQIAAKQRGTHVRVQKITASRGKYTRAEPVAALYEQGLVYHAGIFEHLERQCCEWVPGLTSPDRMDALVWALTVLFIHRRGVLYPEAEARAAEEGDDEPLTWEDQIKRGAGYFPSRH